MADDRITITIGLLSKWDSQPRQILVMEVRNRVWQQRSNKKMNFRIIFKADNCTFYLNLVT